MSGSRASERLGARIGLAGGTARTTIADVQADAAWAADAQFDSYWLSFVRGVDPLVALAVAGADASSGDIELGTSVVPFAGRHPIALAQMARTTQQACDGRFALGVGPSHQIVVEHAYGEPWACPLQRSGEYLDALIALCNGETAAVVGNQVTARAGLDIPSEPVPVLLAALGPRMLELAGEATTGTHVGQCGPETIRTHTAPTINAAAAAAGRDRPRIVALVNLAVTDDPSAVRRAAAPGFAGYGALPSYRAMLDREGVEDPTDLLLAGSIEQIAEGLAGYVEAGATDLRIGVVAADDADRDQTRDALATWLA